MGNKNSGRKPKPIDWDSAQKLREDGLSVRKIATMYGLNFKTVAEHTITPERTWVEGKNVLITHLGIPTMVNIKKIKPRMPTGHDDTVITNVGEYPLHLIMVLHEDAVKKQKIKKRNQRCGR